MDRLEPKRCLGCGYILEGLPENRCPECARAFDPDDPKTYYLAGKARTGALHLVLALLAPGTLMFPWFLARALGGNTICLLSILSVALQVYVAVRGFRELLKPPWRQPRRICWWSALLISLFMLLGCGSLLYALGK
jgi:hypothetical protein